MLGEMTDAGAVIGRRLRLRYPGQCATCGIAQGGRGESALAARVTRDVGDAVIPLHDRLIPGTKGNIDQIFVAPTGVWVVDAKTYKSRVEKRDVGPLWREENRVPAALCKRLRKKGPLTRAAMEHIATRLDLSLPQAP